MLRRLIRRSSVNPEDVIAVAEGRIGRPPRVLDFGVGSGRMAIPRISTGLDLFGTDIDRVAIERGRAALVEIDQDRERFVPMVGSRAPFPDGYFDVVYSETVLEHVADLESYVAEAYRLTAPGGVGLHSFPGRYRWQEAHLFMPLVQWFPGWTALVPISAFTIVRVEPPVDDIPYREFFPDARGASWRRRVASYYRWLRSETFYRSRSDVDAAFRAAGFRTEHPRNVVLSALTMEYVITTKET